MESKATVSLIGLSAFGFFFAAHANAFNVIKISSQNQNEFQVETAGKPITKGMLGSASGDVSKNAERKITFKSKKYNLKLVNEEADKAGIKHARYTQTYDGIPLWGRQIIQHQKKTAVKFFGSSKTQDNFSGQLVTGLENEIASVKMPADFTNLDALELAKQLHKKQTSIAESQDYIYENVKSELVIYTYSDDGVAKLAYHVSFFADDPDGNKPSRPSYLIDAQTKKIIKKWNKLRHGRVGTGPGGNEKVGKYEYGKDRPKLEIREAQHNECFMTNSKVRTVNLKNGYYGLKTHHFKCYESNEDGANGAYSPMNDAHYYGEKIYDMYQEWYDKPPLDFKLIMRVHYGRNYENAFWNGSSMTFGDGRDSFYPLVSLDVAAHEISHGFTEQNSGLEMDGQSGGLDESFADMAAKASEFYAFGKNSWTLGSDITKGTDPLRYLDTPENDGESIADVRDYNPLLNVHYTSGVFNKAFYLLATSADWTTKKAFDVFVHANKYYWTPTTTFNEAAFGAINSADDLGYKVEDLIQVFKQVGMDCTIDKCKNLPEDRPADQIKNTSHNMDLDDPYTQDDGDDEIDFPTP